MAFSFAPQLAFLAGPLEAISAGRQYIERLSLIMTLHDVDFTGAEAERYMRLALSDKDTSKERTEMLRKKRNGTLDEIHTKQEQLDRLDFLRFEITKSNH